MSATATPVTSAPVRGEAPSFERLFDPRSVAVLGASSDPTRIGGRPIAYMLEAGFRGEIFPVNPKYQTVQGLRSLPSVDELPDGLDVAIVALPARFVVDAVRQLGRKGTGFAVVFSSGFAETGEEGRRLQDDLVEAAATTGIRVLGPNTNGWCSSTSQVIGSFGSNWLRDGSLPLPDGGVSFITQSGAFGSFIYAMAQDQGVDFRHFAAVGNECDVSFSELLAHVIEDPEIKAVGGYIEGLRDGSRFREVARRANELGKPLVFVKVGRSDRSQEAAASHTAALAGSDSVYDGVFEEANVIRVDDVQQMLDVLALAERGILPSRPALGLLSISGGTGVWAADHAAAQGLQVATLDARTRERLDGLLPAYGSSLNPVDATAQLVNDPAMLQAALSALLEDENVDVVYLAMGLQEATGERFAREILDVAAEHSTPLVVSWVCGPQSLYSVFERTPVPIYRDFARPLEALGRVGAWQERRHSHGTEDAHTADDDPCVDGSTAERGWDRQPGTLAEQDAKRELSRLGMPVAAAVEVHDASAAVAVWADFGGRGVLKAGLADAVLHKTDLGLVIPNLSQEQAVREAFEQLRERVVRTLPEDAAVFIEPQAPDGVEVLVSLVEDPVFGWQIVVGVGGELVELIAESRSHPVPLTEAQARLLLAGMPRLSTLLKGYRGKPAADTEALVATIVALGRLPELVDELKQLELNPVRVHPRGEGCSVLDAVWINHVRTAPPAPTTQEKA